MDSCFNIKLAQNYKSKSQKIRAMSESWVAKDINCPACGNVLQRYENNRPVADFYCSQCNEDFELKSTAKKWGKKIMAGSYKAMRRRIKSKTSPNFFFLHYNEQENYSVDNLFCIPKQFFTADIIEKRRPLSSCARRAR